MNIPPDSIEILPAPHAEQTVFENLLELYCYDFSTLIDLQLGADGRYGYKELGSYWTDPARFPFLIRIGGVLAGFALIHDLRLVSEETLHDMAEFFILRSYRRSGFGSAAVHALFQRFPGPWQVRVMERNQAADAFWKRAIENYAGQPAEFSRITANHGAWKLYRFTSPGHSADA